MAALTSLVTRFVEKERGAANILPLESVTAQAVAAVSYYAGFAALTNLEEGAAIDESVDITVSEWAEIRPLFVLYVERETALQMEATGILSAGGGYGRSSSEVGGEIAQLEADMPRRVFFHPVVTV
ncbi:hypothetical protein [Halomonas sp. OfavH-34-E]|uniref:hypothetical protein n=1 Tax=Halomonas sp. OfavH-34-E TaxID=2954491 RepID=UPI0020972340|nr:hypothetical protein [Halomonas sp. OfavH-34-E]MCO7216887.1 hypothetical protein [Halomonas sp. OfavH-34-E]